MWDTRGAGGGSAYIYFNNAAEVSTFAGTFTIPTVLYTWRHWAMTRVGTTWKLYIDGTQVGTGTDNTTYTASGAYRFGLRYSAESASLIGLISNLRFVKGQALYTGSFTPSTTPLTKTTVGSTGAGAASSITGTVTVLTLNATTIVDSSDASTTITSSGVKPNRNTPFGYTTQSSTSYTPSLHGGSAYFDGTGDYLTPPLLNFGTADFTVEAWVYPTTSGDGSNNQILYISNGPTTRLAMRLNSANKMDLYLNAVTPGVTTYTSNTVLVPNSWYHLAAVRSSGVVSLYVNGILDNTPSASVHDISDNTTYTYIGSIGASTQPFTGYISDFRLTRAAVYKSSFVPPTQTLTNYSTTYPSSLLLNFTNGGIIDQHSTNVLETVGNAQLSTAVKKYNNGSIYFDGTGDYLKIPSSPNFEFGTGDFTIEGWVYLVSTSSYSTIISNRTTDTDNTAGRWSVAIRNSAFEFFSGGSQIISSGTVSTSTWTFFAVTRASGSLKLFLNGTQVGSTTSFTTSLSALSVSIGANGEVPKH